MGAASGAGSSLVAARLRGVKGFSPEVKYVGARVVDANFNNTIAAPDLYPVCPDVSQGVGDYQRLGTRIRGRYLYVRGTVSLNDAMNTASGGFTTQSNGPIIVRLMILSNKQATTNGQIGGIGNQVSINTLLDDRIGTGATRAFAGNNYDIYAPLNKDTFVVHMDRKVNLIPQEAAGIGTYPYMGQRTYSFVCRIKAPAMTFDDTALGNSPANFAPFLCAGWAYANDKTPGTSDQVPVHIQAISTLYFTDA